MPETEVGQMLQPPEGVDALDWLDQIEGREAAGEAAPDDQTPPTPAAETTEAPAEGSEGEEQPEAATSPGQDDWFVPGKFRTPDDMLTSYTELEQARGRLANDLGQTRQQVQQYEERLAAMNGAAPTLPQQGQQPMQPYMPAYDHPQQGYTREQLEQMQYEDVGRYADWVALARIGEMFGQIAPILQSVSESTQQQDARAAYQTLKDLFGNDMIQRHSEALSAVVREDAGYFIDEGTRLQRLSSAVKALEFDRIQKEGTTQPRTPTGQFAARESSGVHVEAGSSGHGAAPAPQSDVDPVIAEMRAEASNVDRFGHKPRI